MSKLGLQSQSASVLTSAPAYVVHRPTLRQCVRLVWQRKVRINAVECLEKHIILYRPMPIIADAAVVPRVDQFHYHFDRCYC